MEKLFVVKKDAKAIKPIVDFLAFPRKGTVIGVNTILKTVPVSRTTEDLENFASLLIMIRSPFYAKEMLKLGIFFQKGRYKVDDFKTVVVPTKLLEEYVGFASVSN